MTDFKKYAVPYMESGEMKVKLFDSLGKADEFIMKYNRSDRPQIYERINKYSGQ